MDPIVHKMLSLVSNTDMSLDFRIETSNFEFELWKCSDRTYYLGIEVINMPEDMFAIIPGTGYYRPLSPEDLESILPSKDWFSQYSNLALVLKELRELSKSDRNCSWWEPNVEKHLINIYHHFYDAESDDDLTCDQFLKQQQ